VVRSLESTVVVAFHLEVWVVVGLDVEYVEEGTAGDRDGDGEV
jgi:hypothetical protein